MGTITLDLTDGKKGYRSAFDDLTASDLKVLLASIKVLLCNHDLEYVSESNPQAVDVLNRLFANGANKIVKAECVILLDTLTGHISNCINIAREAQPHFLDVLRNLVLESDISFDRYCDLLNLQSVDYVTYGNWYVNVVVCGLGCFLKVVSESYGGVFFYSNEIRKKARLTLDWRVKAAIIDELFLPEDTMPKVVDSLPESCGVMGFAKNVEVEFMSMVPLHSAGKLLTPTGTFSPAKALKVADTAMMKTFDVRSRGLFHRQNLCVLAVGLYLSTLSQTATPDIRDFLKWVVKKIFAMGSNPKLMQNLLPSLASINKGVSDSIEAMPFYLSFIDFIKETDGKWFSPDGFNDAFALYISLNSGNRRSRLDIFELDYDSRNCSLRDVSGEIVVSYNGNVHRCLTVPFVDGLFMLLFSLGILEVAYEGEQLMNFSQIKAWRLTDMGLYALGIKRQLEVSAKVDTSAAYDVDDANRIVTVLDPSSPFVAVLEQMGYSIGSWRYCLSARHLVTMAKTHKEVEKRIQNFRTYICPDPGPNVQALMTEALHRARGSLECKTHYRLVKINPEANGIIGFIADNKDFAEHIIMAQHSILLVDADYYSVFVSRMLAAGYIV